MIAISAKIIFVINCRKITCTANVSTVKDCFTYQPHIPPAFSFVCLHVYLLFHRFFNYPTSKVYLIDRYTSHTIYIFSFFFLSPPPSRLRLISILSTLAIIFITRAFSLEINLTHLYLLYLSPYRVFLPFIFPPHTFQCISTTAEQNKNNKN